MVKAMSQNLRTLAMDSTAPVGSIAFLKGTQLLIKDFFQGKAGHVVMLPQALARLLEQVPISCANLDLIVVTIGPGSFAGVRIALACAKGMALAHRTPVIGVSTLDLLAAGAGQQQGWVTAVMDARRGEIFAALYRLEQGIPYLHKQFGVAHTPEKWAETLATMPELQNDPICLTGSGLKPYGKHFQTALGERCTITPESSWQSDPYWLGKLGQRIYVQQNHSDHTPLLEPIRADLSMQINYQRQPEAQEKKYGKIPCEPEA